MATLAVARPATECQLQRQRQQRQQRHTRLSTTVEHAVISTGSKAQLRPCLVHTQQRTFGQAAQTARMKRGRSADDDCEDDEARTDGGDHRDLEAKLLDMMAQQQMQAQRRQQQMQQKLQRQFDTHSLRQKRQLQQQFDTQTKQMEGRIDQLEADKKQMKGRIDQMKGRIDQLEADKKQMKGRIDQLETNLELLCRIQLHESNKLCVVAGLVLRQTKPWWWSDLYNCMRHRRTRRTATTPAAAGGAGGAAGANAGASDGDSDTASALGSAWRTAILKTAKAVQAAMVSNTVTAATIATQDYKLLQDVYWAIVELCQAPDKDRFQNSCRSLLDVNTHADLLQLFSDIKDQGVSRNSEAHLPLNTLVFSFALVMRVVPMSQAALRFVWRNVFHMTGDPPSRKKARK